MSTFSWMTDYCKTPQRQKVEYLVNLVNYGRETYPNTFPIDLVVDCILDKAMWERYVDWVDIQDYYAMHNSNTPYNNNNIYY